jgi:hypothetical protein
MRRVRQQDLKNQSKAMAPLDAMRAGGKGVGSLFS